MTANSWKDRLAVSRDAAQSSAQAISASARDAAASARARIGSTYGHARNRAAELAADGRAFANDGAQLGTKAVTSGRKVMDRAMVSSRDLIAERPVSAVIVGLAAGAVLGFLANHLVQQRREAAEADAEDDFIGG